MCGGHTVDQEAYVAIDGGIDLQCCGFAERVLEAGEFDGGGHQLEGAIPVDQGVLTLFQQGRVESPEVIRGMKSRRDEQWCRVGSGSGKDSGGEDAHRMLLVSQDQRARSMPGMEPLGGASIYRR